jgi:hypothetical protein
MALTKEQILAADDLGLLEVPVKSWGGSVYIRVMSVAERDAYENEWIRNRKAGIESVDNFRTKFLQKVLCNESGELLFTTAADVDALGNKSAKVMSLLWQKAMEHNALSEEDVQELGKA